MMAGTGAVGHGCGQVAGTDRQQQGAAGQGNGAQGMQVLKQGGPAAREQGPQEAQQRLAPQLAGRHEVGTDAAGEGMGGIHHPHRPLPCHLGLHQGRGHGLRAADRAHRQLQGRGHRIGTSRRTTHHPHPQPPAPRQQGLGQEWTLPGSAQQPEPVPRMVGWAGVHQDGCSIPWVRA